MRGHEAVAHAQSFGSAISAPGKIRCAASGMTPNAFSLPMHRSRIVPWRPAIAFLAVERFPQHLSPPLRRRDPRAIVPGRVMPDMLVVPALQLGYPMLFIVQKKADDQLFNVCATRLCRSSPVLYAGGELIELGEKLDLADGLFSHSRLASQQGQHALRRIGFGWIFAQYEFAVSFVKRDEPF